MTKGNGNNIASESATPNQARSTIAVVGLGAIGGVIAGALCSAELHDIVVCVRRPMARLIFEGPEGTIEMPKPG
jgi:2-dehydropantoate 2-reductase